MWSDLDNLYIFSRKLRHHDLVIVITASTCRHDVSTDGELIATRLSTSASGADGTTASITSKFFTASPLQPITTFASLTPTQHRDTVKEHH